MLWRSNKRKNSAGVRPESGVTADGDDTALKREASDALTQEQSSAAEESRNMQSAGNFHTETAGMQDAGKTSAAVTGVTGDNAFGTEAAAGAENTKAGAENAPQVKPEMMQHSEEARKMYDGLQELRKSVHLLKNSGIPTSQNEENRSGKKAAAQETEALRAAHKAIVEQARKDAREERKKHEEELRRRLELRKQEEKAQEARKRAEAIEREAERKRQEALEAEKRARDIAMKPTIDAMGSEFKAQQAQNGFLSENASAEEIKRRIEAIRRSDEADERAARSDLMKQSRRGEPENAAAALGEKYNESFIAAGEEILEAAKEAELKEAGAILQAQKQEIENFRFKAKQRDAFESERERLRIEKKKAAEARNIAEKERVRAIKERRAAQKLAEKKAEKERREKKSAEKLAEKERRAALKKKREAEAELGGGIVKVKGVEITTRVNLRPKVSLKDFLGIKDKEEKKASTPEEQEALRQEREERREKAREDAARLSHLRWLKYERSALGRKMREFKIFCEKHKKILLLAFSVFLTVAVGIAGVFNYCTAYEYSYNGRHLGYVKEKDTVLRITDLVQSALTEDKNLKVVINAKDDISFKRVPVIGSSITTDSSEEVLKRLTYMGDVNVKAYGIYVNGSRIGAVEDKETAAAVLQDIKDKYTSDYKVSEIEEAVFIEKVDIKKSNTPLQDVISEEAMVERLCTSGEKESLHKVAVGETFADIAKLYSMTEDELLDDNEGVDPKKLEVGSTLKIKQNAPVLTVRITEVVTYNKVVKHKVQKKKTKDLYKGDRKTKQKGKDGLNKITARITTVNGEVIDEENLETTVKKEPVKEVILVGSKKRPPTVGSGKFAWPANGGYTLTSNFGSRWGRTHEGIDLGCSVGTDVLASDGGTVTIAGYYGAYGYLVEIDHQNGMVTRYGHNSSVLVNVGDKVYKGQHIAESGNTGRSTGPHIHFEIRVNGTAQNPLKYLP